MRHLLWIGALAIIMAGTGIVIFALAWKSINDRPGEVGSSGQLNSSTGSVVLFVDPIGLSAWNRAYDNRDEAGMRRAMQVFETLSIANGTPVTVTDRNRAAVQVEVTDGQHRGRRGWTDPSSIIP